MRVLVNKLLVKPRRIYTIDSRVVILRVMSSSNVENTLRSVKQRHWMIPSNGPDLTPIERIQSAFYNHLLSSDMMDAIVCQVRLNVSIIQRHESDTTQHEEHSTSNCNGNNNDTSTKPIIQWTLDVLNRYGCPTPSYLWLNHNNKIATNPKCDQQLQHEFYILFHTHEHSIPGNRPLAIGIINEVSSYQYNIRWIASPMNYNNDTNTSKTNTNKSISKRGHVSIHFQYSIGIGCLAPPYKQSLLHGGAIQTNYICHNIIGLNNEENNINNSTNFELMSIEPFIPPIVSTKLSTYDIVLAFGDSILEQLIASKRCPTNIVDSKETSCQNVSGISTMEDNTIDCCCCCHDHIHFGPKIASPLNSRTISTLLNELDMFVQPYLQKMNSTNNSIALILNSALWDVLSDEATAEYATTENDEAMNYSMIDPWEEHLKTLNEYLNHIHDKYSTKNQIQLYWILPTAVHIHRVHTLSDPLLLQKAPQKIKRTKYMSSSRTFDLYQKQKYIIDRINNQQQNQVNNTNESMISMFDIYEATYLSADWTLPGDGRHYRPELNQLMLSWFY